jgi:hypothetical protein
MSIASTITNLQNLSSQASSLFGVTPHQGIGIYLEKSWVPIYIPSVIITENHTDSLEITDHPIENNTPVSDHFIVKPKRVTLQWATENLDGGTASALSLVGGLSGTTLLSGNFASAFQQASNFFASSSNSQSSISNTTYTTLQTAQSTGQFLRIVTSRRMYESMLIESLTVSTNNETYNAAIFELTCREVIRVSTSSFSGGSSGLALDKTQLGDSSLMSSVTSGIKSAIPSSVTAVAGKLSGVTIG